MTEKEINKIIGQNLKMLRTMKKVRQRDIGNLMGYTNADSARNWACRVENGTISLTVAQMLILCQHFKVSPKDLLPNIKNSEYSLLDTEDDLVLDYTDTDIIAKLHKHFTVQGKDRINHFIDDIIHGAFLQPQIDESKKN